MDVPFLFYFILFYFKDDAINNGVGVVKPWKWRIEVIPLYSDMCSDAWRWKGMVGPHFLF